MKVLLTATVQSHICQFHKLLVEVLHEHGCEVHVAARDNLAEKNGLKLDFVEKVYDVPFARSPKNLDNIRAYKQLKKIIDGGNYDVVHCNTPMGGIVTRLAARSARKYGTKVYYTAHGFHFYKGAPKKNWVIYYPIEMFFSRITDKLITITTEDYRLAKKKFHCQVERIHGVGVDERRYFPVTEEEKQKVKSRMGFAPEQKLILCIGELLPNKNQAMAIHMMSGIVEEYQDAMLLLAGNGPEKEHLEDEICECGLQKNIKMLGYVTNLEEYQHIADILVSCSRREGLPLNIVEAMLSGTPVVASDNRGHRELIKNGKNGILIKIGDVNGMTEKCLQVLDDEGLANFFRTNEIRHSKKYGGSAVKMELETIYQDHHKRF